MDVNQRDLKSQGPAEAFQDWTQLMDIYTSCPLQVLDSEPGAIAYNVDVAAMHVQSCERCLELVALGLQFERTPALFLKKPMN